MKRVLSAILVLVMLMSILAGCDTDQTAGTTEPASGQTVKLWYAYNTESIMRDFVYEDKMNSRDHTLRMQGIRDEVESAQLIVTPSVDVAAFDFEVGDLKSEDGKTFAAETIEVFAERYINVEKSYNNDAYFGYYPDALVPIKAYKKARENSITAGENQGIWINATIPADTAPGFYTGTAQLDLDGVKYDIPIELMVYDVQMPEEVHQESCFLIWYDYIAAGEGYYSQELGDIYYWYLVEKRIMPMYPAPEITRDYDAFVDWVVENAAENPEISTYALPYGYEQVDGARMLSRERTMDMLTKLAVKNVELRQAGNEDIDLFKKAYYYLGSIIDEPSGEAVDRVRKCDLMITECKFAVADEYLKDYPDLYNSLISLSHIVTTAYDVDLLGSDTVGGVQSWCPQFQHWHTQEQREEYWARQNTTDRQGGEEAWWYGCNNPMAPFPTYHLDDDLICPRVISWMQYDYDVDGNLYWCVNCYKEDLWETPTVVGGAVSEGKLMYPGMKYNLSEPISTLRLESIREGLEDYEYMWMMEDIITKYNQENGTDYDPEELMNQFYEDLYNGVIPVRNNGDVFVQRRTALLEALELLCSDPAAGIAALAGE